KYEYVLDPHTAVAVKVYEDYLQKTGDQTYTVVASTASPFKFAKRVLEGINPEKAGEDEWGNLETLKSLTGWDIPLGLQGLADKPTYGLEAAKPEEIPQLIKEVYLQGE